MTSPLDPEDLRLAVYRGFAANGRAPGIAALAGLLRVVPASQMWDDVVHTCGNQRLFCDRDCVAGWLARTGQPGYLMDLATLWRLARGWYSGRLDRGYVRRDPGQARQYFREAGLHGAFWGL